LFGTLRNRVKDIAAFVCILERGNEPFAGPAVFLKAAEMIAAGIERYVSLFGFIRQAFVD